VELEQVRVSALVTCCLSAILLFCSHPIGQTKPGTWQITFQVSGGFAGLDRTLSVSNAGVISAEDRRRGVKATSQATVEDLAQIQSSLAVIKTASQVQRRGQCRDCLLYDFDVVISGERFRAQLDDTTLPKSGLADLTTLLTALVNRTLSLK
jgi:hypothetical protein